MVARADTAAQHDIKLATVAEKVLLVGVDVAADWHYVQVIDAKTGRGFGKAFRVENDGAGFAELDRRLRDHLGGGVRSDVLVALEPTGVYAQPLMYFLKNSGYGLAFVNPYAVKQTKEFIDNSPTKSDPKDALLIANLARNGHFLSVHLREGIYAELRSLSDTHLERRQQRNRLVNRVRTALARYFPEFGKVMRKMDSQSALWLLQHLPMPEDILAVTEEHLARGLGSTYRRPRLERTRARKLRQAAASTIGIPANDEARVYLQELGEELSQAVARLQSCERRMQRLIDKAGPAARLLLTIPGVGPIVAVHLLGRLGDISQYEHPRQMVKMAGLNLTHHSSGHHDGRRHISKRGSAVLRATLYQAARSVVYHDPAMAAIYGELRTRAKSPLTGQQALCAISTRLLRVIWGMTRHQAAYDPATVLAHRRHMPAA